MRVTHEHLALQLFYDKARARSLFSCERLTTARFELIYREMLLYGTLDLVFEDDGEIFVARAIGVDVVTLAMREGPAFIWPATFDVDPAVAHAVEDMVTPWLLALSRGRVMAGEHVRAYRPSAAFVHARERQFVGAVESLISLAAMAPFVYARRFARERDVAIDCAHGALAAAVVGTVARSVMLSGPVDEFAQRWYGCAIPLRDCADPQVAIVDNEQGGYFRSAAYVVATCVHPALAPVVVPVPVAHDQLFTFDPADAPIASVFGVRAADRVERSVRSSLSPTSYGGSGGRVALVVRDDAFVTGDADTDTIAELAERLRAEGLEPSIVTASDTQIAASDIVHVFGSIDDEHISVATAAARAAGLPFLVSVEPVAPYAAYYEDTLFSALRLSIDDVEREYYLDLFYANRLSFDGAPARSDPEQETARDRKFESACADAVSIILAPGEDVTMFTTRFPILRTRLCADVPVLIAPEAAETPVAHLLPPEPFLLLYGPWTRRSAFLHVLASLRGASFPVVVAGPVSEVDYGISLRRVAPSDVVFVPDPTPAEVAAMYRRAQAVTIPTLRPTGVGRLIRAALCGAIPLVPTLSPLARLVPSAARFDAHSRVQTARILDDVMQASNQDLARDAYRLVAPLTDPGRAFSAVVEQYSRAAIVA